MRLHRVFFFLALIASAKAYDGTYDDFGTPPTSILGGEPIHIAIPHYPQNISSKGVSETCIFTVVIDRNGVPIKVDFISKVFHTSFVQSIREATKVWKFSKPIYISEGNRSSIPALGVNFKVTFDGSTKSVTAIDILKAEQDAAANP